MACRATFTVSGNGNHYISSAVFDRALNDGNPLPSAVFNLDATPPVIGPSVFGSFPVGGRCNGRRDLWTCRIAQLLLSGGSNSGGGFRCCFCDHFLRARLLNSGPFWRWAGPIPAAARFAAHLFFAASQMARLAPALSLRFGLAMTPSDNPLFPTAGLWQN